ncbi:MAG TPA: hypothetical protein PLO37_25255 [Candidatus Hydrogenedentes bacterium]|nr:hypothetical protein [Candidatus Hydrogenedentota bacterium]HPG70166.1 hypothetical protein [Candidatus Hydrogenedentota bacterium]
MGKPKKVVKRRVLNHETFGLCVCWPKTEWAAVPEAGGAFSASVNGARRRLTVASEPCNCRGDKPHEHRFLVLPASCGLAPGDYAGIEV